VHGTGKPGVLKRSLFDENGYFGGVLESAGGGVVEPLLSGGGVVDGGLD
jgi:hypothetical protein